MILVDRPSPNHGPRPEGIAPSLLVLHYTDCRDAEEALSLLCDPDRAVSAHYLVDSDGTVMQLVPEERRAWHAGVSFWAGITDVNSHSIGIEIQNGGERFGPHAFPADQIAAVRDLCRGVMSRHGIAARNLLAHSDIAPDRKRDPGALFPWRDLAAAGVGLWPAGDGAPRPAVDGDVGTALRDRLARLGYDPQAAQLFAAFQRRFRPACIDNIADTACLALADDLLRQAGERTR